MDIVGVILLMAIGAYFINGYWWSSFINGWCIFY
jgi:hypothetical protein